MRPQMPPFAFTRLTTACMPTNDDPRNDEPVPERTFVAASLILPSDTPRSVGPPFWPLRHWSAGPLAAAPGVFFPPAATAPEPEPVPPGPAASVGEPSPVSPPS